MVRCSSECLPACDFCLSYAHNNEPYPNAGGELVTVYVGKGECKHEGHPGCREPYEWCDDFHCSHCKGEDNHG